MGVAIAINDEDRHEPASVQTAVRCDAIKVEAVVLGDIAADPAFAGTGVPMDVDVLGFEGAACPCFAGTTAKSSSRPTTRAAITRSDARAMG